MKTLTPAYGRDYKSRALVIADLEANKDFILNDITSRWDGKPMSPSDLAPGERVQVRYGKLRKVFVWIAGSKEPGNLEPGDHR